MFETNQELIQQFYVSFQASRSDLCARLKTLKSQGSPSTEALNEITLEIVKLRKDLTDATVYLPSYDQRQYELHLKSIERSLSDLRTSSTSKSKFSFKRKQPTQSSQSTVTVASSNTSDPKPPPNILQSTGRVLSDRTHAYLTALSIPASGSASDLTLANLDHCLVDLVNSPAGAVDAEHPTKITALHVRDVSNSILLLPPTIDGSAMFHNLTRCIIVLGCHQFRMHTSKQIQVYLAISSSPIIEHCSEIAFTGYPGILCQNDEQRDKASIASNCHSVQDFSHIRPTPSPNWQVLPPEMRLTDEDWSILQDTNTVQDVLSRLLPQ